MIRLYTAKTPNGYKASIALEELGLPYAVHAVDLASSDRPADFLAASPNNKIPAIVDESAADGPLAIFESGAILVYLAERTGRLLPSSGRLRVDVLAWTFWQVGGIGPMLGQLGFFAMRAPEQVPFAIQRYADETGRLLAVMETRLADNAYLGGAEYSIADIATYPWVALAGKIMKDHIGRHFDEKPALARWLEAVGGRPAVAKGMAVPA
jgi:GST-like protein